MSTCQAATDAGLPAANPETVRKRVATLLRYERDSALGFADDTVRPQDTADYRAIAAIFDRILADAASGRYDTTRTQNSTGETAMSHDIPTGTPVRIARPLLDHDGSTGTVTEHTDREGHPAYVIRLDMPLGDVASVVILARYVRRLDDPGPDGTAGSPT